MLDVNPDTLKAAAPPSKTGPSWVYALLRVSVVVAICFLAWYDTV